MQCPICSHSMAVIDHAGIALDQSLKAIEWDGIPFDRYAGVLLSKESWLAAHLAAEPRAKGSRFSPVELMRDLFDM